MYGDLCKHLGIDSSTDHPDRILVSIPECLHKSPCACQILKGIYHCPIELIKRLTDKGQVQYLTKLKGPQVGNYLYTTQFLT